ncbi:hypothetical protein ACIRQY_22595 [Streptomyces sp. NPDC101490]
MRQALDQLGHITLGQQLPGKSCWSWSAAWRRRRIRPRSRAAGRGF